MNFYNQAYKNRRTALKEANNNEITTTNGHIKQNGHVTENGNVVNRNGNVIPVNGSVVNKNGHVANGNGHIITEKVFLNGFTKLNNGSLQENGCLNNGYTNGHAVHDSTEKEKMQ